MDDIPIDRELICTLCSKSFVSINDLQVKCLKCERTLIPKCDSDDQIKIPYSKMGLSDLSSDIRCLQNEQLVNQLHPSSTTPRFAPLQSIFSILIKRNEQLNEKVDRLKNQFHQQHQIHCKELKANSDSLNICIIQLSQRLHDDEIQMKRFEDENRQLKEQVSQLEKQNQQQSQTCIEQFEEFNDRLNLYLKQLNDQSKKNDELPGETDQLKEEIFEHKSNLNEPEVVVQISANNNQSQIDLESLPNRTTNRSDILKKRRPKSIVTVAQSNTDHIDDESTNVNTTGKYEDKINMLIHKSSFVVEDSLSTSDEIVDN